MRIAKKTIVGFGYALLAFGVGAIFFAVAAAQSGAVNQYQNAPRCGTTDSSHCYELFPGTIHSVQVTQRKGGERDQVVILTDAGSLQATLEPSAEVAPHIRTGAAVTALRYDGQVMQVEVDGYWVPSTANPATTQSDFWLFGSVFIVVGLVAAAWTLLSRRTTRVIGSLERLADDWPGAAQPDLLASGKIGWEVRPHPDLGGLARFGVAALFLVGFTTRALFDPARSGWAMLIDATAFSAGGAAMLLFLGNTRVFADHEQVGKSNLFGRTQTRLLSDIERVERFSVANKYGKTKHLVFVQQDGHKAFEVAGQFWDFQRLDAFVKAVGIKTSGSYDDVVGTFSLNKRVPGMISWVQQAALLVVIIALAIPLVILISGPASR